MQAVKLLKLQLQKMHPCDFWWIRQYFGGGWATEFFFWFVEIV